MPTKTAIIVFGRNAGKTVAVCTDTDCSVHNPHIAKQRAADPPLTMAPAAPTETEEEAQQRKAEYEEQSHQYEVEQQRKEEERKQQLQREQKEYEAEQTRRGEQRKTREATFECIVAKAPVTFTPPQLRVLLRAIVNLDPNTFADDLADHLAGDNENEQRTAEEVLLTSIDALTDDNLTALPSGLPYQDTEASPRRRVRLPHRSIERLQSQNSKEAKAIEAKKPAPIKATAKPVKRGREPKQAIAG